MTETASNAPTATPRGHGGSADRLGPFLCWAVVFADIGTSVYYVPGILYSQVGRLAGVFVTMTLIVFLLLTIKYAEATVRFPEGGGEVAVASRGLNPWFGALGGMFILIDYFLTASISSLSGLHYFEVIFPPIAPYVVGLTLAVIIALGVLNWWGIQESASVSAVIATLAFLSSIVIVVLVVINVPLQDIGSVFREIFSGARLTGVTILTGFAGAFLAFSGLESIAQLAPVMRVPRRKTVTGGSQGARRLNQVIVEALPDLLPRCQVLHVSGEYTYEETRAAADRQFEALPGLRSRYALHAYLSAEMPAALAASDIVLCRSGAATLAELAVMGRPSLLIPLPPGFTGSPQQINAEMFVKAGAAEMALDKDLTPDRLCALLVPLLGDPARRDAMAGAARQFAHPEAAAKLADSVAWLAWKRTAGE